MSCTFSRGELALYAEGDLPAVAAQTATSHVVRCEECRRFLEQLRARQLLLKSLRRETVSRAECAGMRRAVMAIISERRDRSGWALRLERTIVLGVRRRSYALAAGALLAITSVSVLAQMRHAAPGNTPSMTIFAGSDGLLRPDGYRNWMIVGPSAVPPERTFAHRAAGQDLEPIRNVYINPSGYQGYASTGQFPDGTVMVWESAGREAATAGQPHQPSSRLLAAAKDSRRFDGGWGFFDFNGSDGSVRAMALALPDSNGCRTCHRQDAETDSVFTQFYPVLRSARLGAQFAVPRGTASVTAAPPWSGPVRLLRPLLVAQT